MRASAIVCMRPARAGPGAVGSLMSTSKFRRSARVRVDDAISAQFALLWCSRSQRLAFDNLVHQARTRSSLLQVRGDGSDQLLAVEALANLAAHHREFAEWPSTWRGGEADVYTLVHSLASHLLCRYPVPRGFAMVWFGGTTPIERAERSWFVAHGGGQPFRKIAGLPMAMTRKMERILLASPPHLGLREAMRRAEILALGGPPELVEAIQRTRVAVDLDDGEFWREAMQWFVEHWDELGEARTVELVELFLALREVTPAGSRGFSLVGRTPESLERTLAQWRRDGGGVALGIRWPGSGLAELDWSDEIGRWAVVELTSAKALSREGQALRHCVGGYWTSCLWGRTSIWSVRVRTGEDRGWQPRCTFEVHPDEAAIVQIRGFDNRKVRGRQRKAIERWAEHAGMEVRNFAW